MKKNIGILVTKLADGGAERVASNLSCFLSERFQNNIILYNGKEVDYSYKGKIIDLNTKASSNYFNKLFILIKRIYRVKKIKKDLSIKTTISLMEGPNIVNILTKRNDRTIISVHTFLSKRLKKFEGKIYGGLIKRLYNKADYIVAVSKGIKEDLIMNFSVDESKIKVIYNPIDIERIQDLVNEEIEKRYVEIFNHPVIINMGRLIEAKGQWHLIRAFKKVKEKVPNAKLVILGQGDLESRLKNLARELSLENDIHFLGFEKNPFKYISKSTVYVSTSICEGFPNSLIEAMVCGMPVASTDCKSGPREIIAPYSNIFKETKSVEYAKYGALLPAFSGDYLDGSSSLLKEEIMIASTIVDLIKNRSLREKYIDSSNKRAKDFHINTIINQWENII